jgi:hypothetical protein
LRVGVVVNVRRARRAEAEVVVVVIGADTAGAEEKRVRVVEGRRRKEARSLEAIVAGFGSCVAGVAVSCWRQRAIEMRGGDRCSRTWKFELRISRWSV